jgi:hypothetical protein
MDNPELREMVDLATASRWVEWAAAAAAGLAVALLIVGLCSRRARLLLWAATLAPWALLLAIGWRVYLWRVRFDPATGFCGLHSVRVLVGNVAAAAAIGVLYGLYERWLGRLLLSPPHAPDISSAREG